MTPDRTILIAGGGASGALLGARLLRASASARVIIVEPREHLARGMAYSTVFDGHLLNVVASRMSAFPEDPSHFLQYLKAHHPGRYLPGSYAPRRIYGDYLESIVTQTIAENGARLQHHRARVLAATIDGGGVRVACDDSRTHEGDVLVVATGNAEPAAWLGADRDIATGPYYFSSVWSDGALEPSDPDAGVLLLGTGLTAVDAVLALRDAGQRAPIWMISRRGLLPHEHRVFDAPPASNPEAASMHELLREVRQDARRPKHWRAALDGLRPLTNHLWQSLSLSDQRRFIRHVMPYWNVHRHRMAPQIAKSLAAGMADGWLRMLAGRTGRLEQRPGGLRVPVALRGGTQRLALDVGRVINCSGPAHDPRALDNPLISNLIAQGLMRPTALGIGADVSPSGALRDSTGAANERLFTLGPVRFGTLIETTAMPEIRTQAAELASYLVQ